MENLVNITNKRPKPNPAALTAALNHLRDSQEALDKIARTCCLPDRSLGMNSSIKLLDGTVGSLSPTATGTDVEAALSSIRTLGGSVGALFATCCAPIREPHYHRFFQGLHLAHGKLYESMGVSGH